MSIFGLLTNTIFQSDPMLLLLCDFDINVPVTLEQQCSMLGVNNKKIKLEHIASEILIYTFKKKKKSLIFIIISIYELV